MKYENPSIFIGIAFASIQIIFSCLQAFLNFWLFLMAGTVKFKNLTARCDTNGKYNYFTFKY